MDTSKVTLITKAHQQNLGDGYLKFQLNRHTSAVLPIKQTQEVVVVSVEAITSMPNMPACILGLMNWRSRIIWAVNLPKMFNLEYQEGRLRQYNVMIVRVDSIVLGLVVQEIQGTTRFWTDDIRSPVGQVASSLIPYLRGCVIQEKEMLLVLDAQAIVQSSILRND
ncbi:MAG: chemotaxis protein CheW [Scytonema sp. PMC 1069.18]|nr:chemotaxis protein CheW [Scytonema sp. PMC 1069.18]MEC4880763.1 chemotaxis protein CheW [Scytonema sp. PMC 1070.18]